MKIALIIIGALLVVGLIYLVLRIVYVMGLKKGFENCYLHLLNCDRGIRRAILKKYAEQKSPNISRYAKK